MKKTTRFPVSEVNRVVFCVLGGLNNFSIFNPFYSQLSFPFDKISVAWKREKAFFCSYIIILAREVVIKLAESFLFKYHMSI
ncbi:hypothetical protein C1903_07030 [Listeria ivanovii]|nr:hypothetical protein C1905_07550 [Listeria ivanovii]PZF94548.1 hypothetical protein C1903_07030 [Listeria ivanovii]PZG05098.1 hypothetical protein C2L88_07000 [Listeria ivanovii]PZG09740.1 hypothetical protein C1901_07025 [Listeria ivanovii]PZG26563.1 hypothetical protein C1900_07555 [Listeria ivanovii]